MRRWQMQICHLQHPKLINNINQIYWSSLSSNHGRWGTIWIYTVIELTNYSITSYKFTCRVHSGTRHIIISLINGQSYLRWDIRWFWSTSFVLRWRSTCVVINYTVVVICIVGIDRIIALTGIIIIIPFHSIQGNPSISQKSLMVAQTPPI